MATPVQDTIQRVRDIDVDKYKYGFTTDIESVRAPKGLREDVVRFISAKKGEPEWLLEWRLEAYRRWRTMEEPKWARVHYPKIDYEDSITTPRQNRRRGRQALPRSIRSFYGPMKSLASP